MRLQTYLTEKSYFEEEIDLIWQTLLKDCKLFLVELNKANTPNAKFFYRGYGGHMNGIIQKKKTRKDRMPTDTPEAVHTLLDRSFKKKFGWRVRSQGVFTTSDKIYAGGYGLNVLFFPIGKYKYVYSPEVRDLYAHIGGEDLSYIEVILDGYSDTAEWEYRYRDSYEDEEPDNISFEEYAEMKEEEEMDVWLDSVDKTLKTYKSTDMSKAIKSGNETVFQCSQYYIVSMSYEDALYHKMRTEL